MDMFNFLLWSLAFCIYIQMFKQLELLIALCLACISFVNARRCFCGTNSAKKIVLLKELQMFPGSSRSKNGVHVSLHGAWEDSPTCLCKPNTLFCIMSKNYAYIILYLIQYFTIKLFFIACRWVNRRTWEMHCICFGAQGPPECPLYLVSPSYPSLRNMVLSYIFSSYGEAVSKWDFQPRPRYQAGCFTERVIYDIWWVILSVYWQDYFFFFVRS